MHWVGQQEFFFEIVKYRSYNFVDVKVMWQHPWVKFGCVFLNSVWWDSRWVILTKTHEIRTVVLGSRIKQFFFFERYAGVRLIQLSLVSFSTPESADSRNFSGSKVFLLYKCWKCKKLWVVSRNSARVQNYSNCWFWEKKSQVLSEFRNVNLVVLLSVCKTYW